MAVDDAMDLLRYVRNNDKEVRMDSSVEETLFNRHFGMGSEQFKRELEAELEEATPEQRAEFEQLVDQANAVLPEMHATLDRVDASLAGMRTTMHELRHGVIALDARFRVIEDSLLPAAGLR